MATKPKAKTRKEIRKSADKLVTKDIYSIEEASQLLNKISTSKFTGTASIDIVLNVKDKQANESIRGSVVFPHPFAAEKKVLVFAEGDKATEAEKAGADFVGMDDLMAKVNEGWFDFDVVIATPAAMPKIARLGKVLGPKQLMPNPKTGTVTENIEGAVKEYKAGKQDFKMDATKCIKMKFAKLDQTETAILENLKTAIEVIKSETRKLGVDAIKKVTIKPTMGPVIKLAKI